MVSLSVIFPRCLQETGGTGCSQESLGPGGLGRPSQGGHLQPTALPGPHATSQCSCCPHPQGFRYSPLPRTPPPNSAPGCLHPWDNTRGPGRKRNPGEMAKVLYLCRWEAKSRTSSSSFRQSLQAGNQ